MIIINLVGFHTEMPIGLTSQQELYKLTCLKVVLKDSFKAFIDMC